MIESGQIRAALIAAGENGRPLVEETVRTLLAGSHDRNSIKPFFANLTIGCGAVAAIVCRCDLAGPGGHRLLGGVCRAATEHSELCQGDTASAGALAMQTDSERLLEAGVALARETWDEFMAATGWTTAYGRPRDLPPGRQRAQAEALRDPRARPRQGLLDVRDAREHGIGLPSGDARAGRARPARCARATSVALMGIGSGLNCLMLALEW